MGRDVEMRPEDMSDSVIEQALRGIDDAKLEDEWERDFMKSIRAYWKKNHRMSDKQKKRLGEIWSRIHGNPAK